MNKLKFFVFILILVIIGLGSAGVFANKINSQIDFEEVGLNGLWTVFEANEEATAKIVEEKGNKFLNLSGFTQLLTDGPIGVPYEFSLDAQIVMQGEIGFFVRASAIVEKENSYFGGPMMFRLYEEDWYKETGGEANIINSLGANGMYIQIKSQSIRLYIKTYMEDGIKIGNKHYDFQIPEGVDVEDFVNLKFVDDGENVKIYVNQALLARVEMSMIDYYDDDLEDRNQFFTKALVYDDQDNLLLEVLDARIASEESYLGAGNRNMIVNIDNLSVKELEVEASPSPEATKEPEPSLEPSPEKTGVALKEGEKTSSFTSMLPSLLGALVLITAIVAVLIVFLMRKRSK